MTDNLTARYAALLRSLAADTASLHALGLALREDFRCDRVSLFLKASHGVYVSIYAEGLEEMTLAVKPGEGLVGKAVQRRTPVVSNEALFDPDSLSRLRDHYSGYETHSVLVAPIAGRFLAPEGAVQLVNKLYEPFTDDDIRRLSAAAQGLRGLRKLCRRPADNLWEPGLHKESPYAAASPA